MTQSRFGEARIAVQEFITSELLWFRPFDEKIDPLRISYEFSRLFGLKIPAYRSDWSSDRIRKFRLIIAASIQLGFEPYFDDRAGLTTDEKRDTVFSVLSRLVAMRESLLSLNEDDSAPLVDAEECWLLGGEYLSPGYIRWLMENLIPVESLPVLRRKFLAEHIQNILTNFGFPERLIALSKRVGSVYRAYRRRFAEAVGDQFIFIFRSMRLLPGKLLKFEIKAGIVHVEDPEKLAFRDCLEAVIMDCVSFIEVASLKLLSVPAEVIDKNVLDNLFQSLGDFLTRCMWYRESGTFRGSLDEIRRDATLLESTKKAFEALFPT